MIDFQRRILNNGLKVLVHEDPTSPMAAVNVLYDVGSRDEDPSRTGFAHLFEHLMFGGSANVPNFDAELQKAGGRNNAFTSPDITNYYDTLPAKNLEVALWLEADRMNLLDFSERSLEVQRKVVCEEFKEHYINQPYGDLWHKLMALTYQDHPYRWPTIGQKLEHVEDAVLDDVRAFFFKHYRPNQAILSVAGGVKADEVFQLAEKWFGGIQNGESYKRALPKERDQKEGRELTVEANVPVDVLYRAYHMCSRNDAKYAATDLVSDVLSGGESARLHRELVKEQKLFTDVDAYITASMDAGLFIVEGKYAEGVDRKKANKALDVELDRIREEKVSEHELTKVRNQSESTESFGNVSVLNKAMKLGYYQLLGDPNGINTEIENYRKVQAEDIQEMAREVLRPENCSTLNYLSNKN
jgi:predicted Zn-dependent peptidase